MSPGTEVSDPVGISITGEYKYHYRGGGRGLGGDMKYYNNLKPS